jgi:hypothetical protein
VTYSYVEFADAVRRHRMAQGRQGLPCWVCSKMGVGLDLGVRREVAEQRECEARSMVVDAHHLIPKQVLKREAGAPIPGMLRLAVAPECAPGEEAFRELDAALMDPRNGVLVRRYHHDALEARRIVVPKRLWPVDALEFAEELGLGWWVDKMTDNARRT